MQRCGCAEAGSSAMVLAIARRHDATLCGPAGSNDTRIALGERPVALSARFGEGGAITPLGPEMRPTSAGQAYPLLRTPRPARKVAGMSQPHPPGAPHSPVKEPKFCRCRLCHEYFYGETIAEARAACEAHAQRLHPDWHVTTCYCPD